MAVPETSADRVRRFQGKVTSSLQYVIAAAHSGKSYKTEVMEGSSDLLDTTQHFLNAVTTLVVTSGGEITELREQVNTRRHELCCQLAELIRICDKMILSDDVPAKDDTTGFADTITRLTGELMAVIAPVLERRASAVAAMQRTGANHLTTSPQRIMTGTNPRNRSRWASQGSLTLSKSMGLTTSGDLQSLPNDSYMRVESTDSGFSSGEHRALSSTVSAFATMPKSVSRKTRNLFRRPSGTNLFEVKQETKAEVIVPGQPRERLRSSSSTDVAEVSPGPAVSRDNLTQGRGMSLSSPLLDQVKQAGGDSDLQLSGKESAHRSLSHTPNRAVNGRGGESMTLDLRGKTPTRSAMVRANGSSSENPAVPVLPPKKRAGTPGVNRTNLLPDFLANSAPPPRGPNQSTKMMFPPSPDVMRANSNRFGQSPRSSSSQLSGTVTEVRIDSPEGWSPSPSASPVPSSCTSSGYSLSESTPSSSFMSTSSTATSTPRHSAAYTPASDPDPDAPPAKPFHPSLPASRPQSSITDLSSARQIPEKPPHPTLIRHHSSKAMVLEDEPKPMKPPRPPTLTFNPDNPPPIPLKKRALMSYLEQFGTYQSPTEQDLDFAPKRRIGGASTPLATASASTPNVGDTGGEDYAVPAIAPGPNLYQKTAVSRTRSVLGSELLPPPLPAKTKKGSGLAHGSTVKSAGSGRHGSAIQEEPEPSSIGAENNVLEESPPHVPVGSGDSGVHTSSDQLSEDDHLSQSSQSPEVYRDRQHQAAPINLLYYSDVDYYLVFNEEAEGHSLLGGPVDALIAHAAADQKHESDRLYHEAFLLTYRTFVEPDVLIEKLLERHDVFLEAGNDVICHATLSLLLRVVDEIRGSMDKNITQRLLDTVFRLLCDNELKLGQLLHNKLFENLKSKGQRLKIAREMVASSRGPPPADWNITRFRSRQVALQLTLIDYAFYNAVEIHECLTWSVHQSEERCPTLTVFTEHFNNVSYWVRTRLLDSEKKSEREKVMAKFIKVIEHLRYLNNFNSMFALLAAMDCAAVNRMNWSKEVIKSLEEPRKIIDNVSGFKNYRDALEAGGSPCIPYLGLYLQDLTFINIGNSNMLDDNKDCVNFAKRWRQFKVMCKIKQYQQHGYEACKRDEEIIQYFNGFTNHLGEEDLWDRSMALKPRGQGPA